MHIHLNKLEFPTPKDALFQVCVRLAQWFWRKRFLNSLNKFSLLCYYLSLEKGVVLHLNKMNESRKPKDVDCLSWLELVSGSWEEYFVFPWKYFHYLISISTWKRMWSFISTILNFLPPKIALCQVCLKLVQRFWRRGVKTNI